MKSYGNCSNFREFSVQPGIQMSGGGGNFVPAEAQFFPGHLAVPKVLCREFQPAQPLLSSTPGDMPGLPQLCALQG